MSKCTIISTTTKGASKLAEKLFVATKGDEALTEELFSKFYTPVFKKEFGDWELHYKLNGKEGYKPAVAMNVDRLNEIGEPEIFKYEDSQNSWYYLDKHYNKKPVDKDSIFEYATYAQLRDIASSLVAYTYSKEHEDSFDKDTFAEAMGNTTQVIKDFVAANEERIKEEMFIIDKEMTNAEEKGESTDEWQVLWDESEMNMAVLSAIETNEEEFTTILKEYLSTLGISQKSAGVQEVIDEENSEKAQSEQEKTGSVYNLANYEVDAKDSLSAVVRMDLSFIPSNESTDMLGNQTFIPADTLWNNLVTILHDPDKGVDTHGRVNDVFTEMYHKINNTSEVLPYLKEVIKLLDTYSENKKNQFAYLGLSKINFNLTTVAGNPKDGFSFNVLNISDANSNRKQKLKEWGKTFSDKYTDGYGNMLPEKKKELNQKWASFMDLFNKSTKTMRRLDEKKKRTRISLLIGQFHEYLEELGVTDISKDVLMSHLRGFALDGGKMTSDLEQVWKNLAGEISNIDYAMDYINNPKNTFENEEGLSNPLEAVGQSIFKDLSSIAALVGNNLSDGSVVAGGKQYYSYTLPSYLSQAFTMIKKNRQMLVEMKEKDDYVRNSKYIDYLLAINEDLSPEDRMIESDARIEEMLLFYFNSFKKSTTGTNSVDNGEIQFADQLSDYINKELQPKIDKPAIHRTLTPADKKTSIEFTMGQFFDAGIHIDGNQEIQIADEVVDVFVGYAEDDYAVAKEAYRVIRKYELATDPIEKQKAKEELRLYKHVAEVNGEFRVRDDNGNLVGNAFKMNTLPSLAGWNSATNEESGMWNEDGSPTEIEYKPLTSSQKAAIRPTIIQALRDRIKYAHAKAVKENVFTGEKQGTVYTYKNNTIDKNIWEQYKGESPSYSVIGDFTINAMISQIEYAKMFLGDPSYYKSIPDYQKRAPAPYSTGIYPRATQRYFKIAVVDAIEGPSNYAKELNKQLGNTVYSNINTADAQAWITPERWKFLIQQSKGWNESLDKVYAKITGATKEELTPKEAKLAAQPLKGTYFNKDTAGQPTFLKYSQFVIHKGLAKNNGIAKILKEMESKNIDEVVTLDAIKVGAGIPVPIHDENMKIKDEFSLTTIDLDNRFWKIQQDLPTKGIKDASKLSSQLMKNIFSYLEFNKEAKFDFQGQEVTGANMINYLESLTGRLSDIGREELRDLWAIDDEGRINNEEQFRENILNEYRSKKNPDINVVKALEKGMSPLAIIQTYPKMMSIMLSMIDKRTIDLKTPGAGFIQVSHFGIDDLTEGAKNDIIYFNEGGRKELKPPMIIDGKVQPGQVLLSHSEFRKYFPKLSIEDAKNIDPRALQIVGYRIPNQKLSSTYPVDIVGILPEGIGDAVVAYSEITKQTGSDFDIDKSFLMMPALKFDKKTNKLEYVEPIVEEEKTLPLSEQPKAAVQNLLLEAYRSILLNPVNFNELMSPVDDDTIKDNIYTIIGKPETGGDLQVFDPMKQLETKFEFLGGQAGIGQSANYLVDNSYSQHFNLTLHNTGISDQYVNTISEGVIALDRKNTMKLSPSELASYVRANPGVEAKAIEQLDIFNSISMFVNGFVDIAKDAFLSRGNWNTQTTNVGLGLIRAGMHPFRVNAILNQPAIKLYVNELTKMHNLTARSFGDAENKVLRSLGFDTDTTVEAEAHSGPNLNLDVLTEDLDINEGSNPQTKTEFAKRQLAMLMFFKDMRTRALVPVSNMIRGGKFDVDGLGGNLSTSIVYDNLLAGEIEAKSKRTRGWIEGLERKFVNTGTGKNTMIGSKYDNSIEFLRGITEANSKYFLMNTEGVRKAMNYVSFELLGTPLKDKEVAKKIELGMYSFIMSGFDRFSYNSLGEKIRAYKKVFVDLMPRIEEYKETEEGKNNYFIQNIGFVVQKHGNFVTVSNNRQDTDYKNNMYRGWLELMESNKALSDDIALFSFYQSGFTNNTSEIYSYLPHEWMLENNVNAYINSIGGKLEGYNAQFFDQFVKHNWKNEKLVKKIKPTSKNFLSVGRNFSHFFVRGKGPSIASRKNIAGEDIYIYPPFITKEGIEDLETGMKAADTLFELAGYYEAFPDIPEKREMVGVYKASNKLGIKSKTSNAVEYSFKTDLSNSVFKFNNVNEYHKEQWEAFLKDQGHNLLDRAAYESVTQMKEPFTVPPTIGILEAIEKDAYPSPAQAVEELDDIDNILNCRI